MWILQAWHNEKCLSVIKKIIIGLDAAGHQWV